MIHTIEVNDATEPEPLRKEFRKLLMTGGAVVRIAPGLSESELERIFMTFAAAAEPHSLHELVLRAIAALETLSADLEQRLAALDLPGVNRELSARRKKAG